MLNFLLTLLIAQSVPEHLTLQEALAIAYAHQPQLMQARAQVNYAQAGITIARAPLLPQVNVQASYESTTSNYVPRPGASLPSKNIIIASPSYNMFNYWQPVQLTVNQLIYDFGYTWDTYRASEETRDNQRSNQQTTLLQIENTVRTTYFLARAAKNLVRVAQETLVNQEKHLKQTKAFIDVGTHAEIELATALTNVANAKVQLITADNNYALYRAQLNQAMGVQANIAYDVVDDPPAAVQGENAAVDVLLEEAIRNRPELKALMAQIRNQTWLLEAAEGTYWPSLSGQLNYSDQGTSLKDLRWNWNVQLLLNWNLFQGGLTTGQVAQNIALLASLKAQLEQESIQIRLDIEQATLNLRANKESLVAATEAVSNAHLQLDLAEGRYENGLGNMVELSDAQVAVFTAEGQKIQTVFTLATARANLLKALGRNE